MPETLRIHRFGILSYEDAYEWQEATAAAVRDGAEEALALLQHPHVYTFGRRAHAENLLVTPIDAEVIESDRGGGVTYHGPGQLVAYAILNLRRRHLGAAAYVRLLEAVMIRTAESFGVEAHRVSGRPGVWVDDSKLGAIGVRVRGGVTTHGLALNVCPDLSRFDAIVPCGLQGIMVTSLERELGRTPDFESTTDALISAFASSFDCEPQTWAPTQSTEPHALHSPSPNVGEGRAAAGVRSDPALIVSSTRQGSRPSQPAVPLGR